MISVDKGYKLPDDITLKYVVILTLERSVFLKKFQREI